MKTKNRKSSDSKSSDSAPIVDRVARTMTCRLCGETSPWPMSAANALAWGRKHSECGAKKKGAVKVATATPSAAPASPPIPVPVASETHVVSAWSVVRCIDRRELISVRDRAWALSRDAMADVRAASAAHGGKIPAPDLLRADLLSVAWTRLAIDCDVLDAILARRAGGEIRTHDATAGDVAAATWSVGR